ncbi:MAG TPA: hypothetical protein VKO87_06850, partial [Gemmatimonadaceae bacterium]|nr:hypothetical protein [Gemmatimonadaceae bacterium]
MLNSLGKGTVQGLRTAAIGSSVVAIGLGSVYWIERIGFANPVAPVLAAVGLALLFINAPVVIWSSVHARREIHRWTTSYPLVWIAVFAAIAATGRAIEPLDASPSITLAPLGALALVVVLIPWARASSLRSATLLIAGSAYFSTWAGGVVWGRIYKSPLFMEMLIGTGIVHHDGVTLAALGNMLRTYHVASMGLDGVSYMAYHWGTPWLFAQLSNLTGESVLQFYQLGFPVTMIPLFFGSVVAFASVVRNADPTRDWRFWALFIAATVGVFPITGMDALGVWTSNLMISESYTVGIPCASMLLALTIVFWRERGHAVVGRAAGAGDYMFVFLILPLGLIALGYIKISLMILGFGAVMYAGLRVGAWKIPALIGGAVWMAALVFLAYQRVSLVAHHEGIAPLDYLKGFVPRVWWPFFLLAHLAWSTLYVVLRLRQERAGTLGDFVLLARARKILDVEMVAVIAIAGVLPGLILHIDGGSAFYFSDVQRWIALGLLLSSVTTLLPRVDRIRWNRLSTIAVLFVAIPLVVSTARNSWYWTRRMVRANAELRYTLYPPDARAGLTPGIRSLPRLADASLLKSGLRSSVNYNPVGGLLELARMPLEEKRSTAVFVPQSEEKYWTILKRPGACSFSGFVVPSLTGMAMI